MSRRAATSKSGVKPPHSKGPEPSASVWLLGAAPPRGVIGQAPQWEATSGNGPQQRRRRVRHISPAGWFSCLGKPIALCEAILKRCG